MTAISFGLEEAIETVNQVMVRQCDRTLTDVETLIVQGVWEKLEYDQIAARNGYATSYLSQDVAPKLWRVLSASLGEKVKKSNFRTVIKRHRLTSDGGKEHTQEPQKPSSPSPVAHRLYIKRPLIERTLYQTLHQAGALVRLKAPRFMGKTTLVSQVLSQLEQDDYRVAALSLEMADRFVHFNDLNRFLRWFCLNISRELGIPSRLDDYWDAEEIGAKVSCTAYFENYLLAQDARPLVLCLDDVDLLFSHPQIYEDFFGLLRSWYEKARTRHLWSTLRLVIVHSTDVYIRLQIHQSPFNVGQLLELPEFSQTQIIELATLYQIEIQDDGLKALVDLVGGHPALLEKMFSHLNTYPTASIQQILTEASTECSLFRSHLREQLLTLQKEPTLTTAFQSVVGSDEPVTLDPLSMYQLQRMGLIALSGNQATPRCQLYRHYFRDRLS